MQKCTDLENCRSVNYNVLTRTCALSPDSRSSGFTVSDENFDFYERSCPHVAPVVTPTSTINSKRPTVQPEIVARYKMVERGRQLSDQFTNRTGIENVQDCWSLCLNSTVRCELISFSTASNQCLLSSFKHSESTADTKKLTKPSDAFDTYAASQHAVPTTTPTPMSHTTTTTTTVKTTKVIATTTRKSSAKGSGELVEDLIFDINDNFMDTTTASSVTSECPVILSNHCSNPGSRVHALPNTETKSSAGNKTSESSALLPLDPELVGLEDTTPMQVPLSSGIAHVEPSRVSVAAHCLPQGMNITFDISEMAVTYR